MAANRGEEVALSPTRHRSAELRLRGWRNEVRGALSLILDGAVEDALSERLRLLVCWAFRIEAAGIVARAWVPRLELVRSMNNLGRRLAVAARRHAVSDNTRNSGHRCGRAILPSLSDNRAGNVI